MKWIYMSSANYQNSFWKLKYVWNKTYKYFDPRHSLMYRKMSKIAGNYQTRLKQYAHFKMVMYYKTMPYPIRRLSQKDQFQLTPNNTKRHSEHRALAFIYKPESIAALSRAHTPVGYRNAFSRAFTPTGDREKSPDLIDTADKWDHLEDFGGKDSGKGKYMGGKYGVEEQAKHKEKGNYLDSHGSVNHANHLPQKLNQNQGYGFEEIKNDDHSPQENPKRRQIKYEN